MTPGGGVAVLDWAVPPTGGSFARAWRWFLRKLEPPAVVDCLDRGYDAELVGHGLQIVRRHPLAGGTAQLMLGRPSVREFGCTAPAAAAC